MSVTKLYCIPGQSCVLHVSTSVAQPTQSAPPPLGAGQLHVLDLKDSPVPHDSEQALHAEKAHHPPSPEVQR